MVTLAETTMGITVFFDEDLSEAEIQNLGDQIAADQAGLIKDMNYISAEEAWNSFQTEYFGEEADLAEGFAEDNPLAGSASYEIFLNNISDQDRMVSYLEGLDGVRKVNYSSTAAAGLTSFNRILAMLFGEMCIRDRFPGATIVLTIGSNGAIFADGKKQFLQPSFPVKAVDTTAAGDTFSGYFIALSLIHI